MANPEMKVLITGDASSAMTALDSLKGAIEGFSSNIAGAVLGFGSLAAVGAAAANKIGEGISALIDIIPNAINVTSQLADQFKILHVTAGLSIEAFNGMANAIQLSGGKVDDLSVLVSGMEKGIKKNSQNLIDNGIAADQAALKHMTLGQYISAVVTTMQSYGDATDRDQLLMAAFGRGGMAFASQLIELNQHMKEGAEIAERNAPLDTQAIKNATELTAAKGRVTIAEQHLQEVIAHGFIGADIAIQNAKAEAIEREVEDHRIDSALVAGIIHRVHVIQDGHTTVMEDLEAEKREWDELNAKIGNAVKSSKDFMDAGMHSGFKTGDALPTRSYIPPAKTATASAEKTNSFSADMIKLDQQALSYADKTTLEKQKQNELDRLALQLKLDLDEIDRKVTEGHLSGHQADLEREKVNGNNASATTGINANYAKKEAEEAQKKIDAANKVHDVEIGSEKAHDAAMYDLQIQAINQRETLGQISSMEALRQIAALNAKKYAAEVADMDRELALEGQTPLRIAQINAQKLALEDRYNKDVSAIRQKEALELQKGNGWAGFLSGLSTFRDDSKNIFKQMAGFATDMANTLTTSLGNAFTNMITKGQSFGAAMKSVWTSVSGAVVGALAQMAAKYLVAALAQKLFASSTAATSDATAASAVDLAASETWAAYAMIPFAGAGLATAQIALMMASITGATAASGGVAAGTGGAFAVGGIISSPTLALMGEAGPELVAPEHDFKDWASANLNLGMNLGAHAAQLGRLQGQAGSYGSSAAGQAGAGGVHVDLRGAVIAGESVESSRIIGNLVKRHLDEYNRRKG